MNARYIRMLIYAPIASIVCIAASYLVARIFISLKNGFGTGDLWAFLYWTILFSIGLLLLALAFAFLTRNMRTINRLWIGTLLGGVAGFGWTLFNLMMLGPWFGAWSFNVLYCWIAGGALGIFTVALLGHSRREGQERLSLIHVIRTKRFAHARSLLFQRSLSMTFFRQTLVRALPSVLGQARTGGVAPTYY